MSCPTRVQRSSAAPRSASPMVLAASSAVWPRSGSLHHRRQTSSATLTKLLMILVNPKISDLIRNNGGESEPARSKPKPEARWNSTLSHNPNRVPRSYFCFVSARVPLPSSSPRRYSSGYKSRTGLFLEAVLLQLLKKGEKMRHCWWPSP